MKKILSLVISLIIVIGMVGCSQKQIDSDVEKLIDEAIGDTVNYELTYGELEGYTSNQKGYTLKIKEDIAPKGNANDYSKVMCSLVLSNCIGYRTNKIVSVYSNNGFIAQGDTKDDYTQIHNTKEDKEAFKNQEEANMFLINENLFEKWYSVMASSSDGKHMVKENNGTMFYTIIAPKGEHAPLDMDVVKKIADKLYSMDSYGKDIEITVVEAISKQEFYYNKDNYMDTSNKAVTSAVIVDNTPNKNASEVPQEEQTKKPESLNEYQATKVKLSGKNDLKEIERLLDVNLKELTQGDQYKYEVTETNGVVQVDITLTDDMYTTYEEHDLNKIGCNLGEEGLKDLMLICYKNCVLEDDNTSFNFIVMDNNARIIYRETM